MPLNYQEQFYNDEVSFIVGVDEAGRGPLAGPVVAAAVVFSRAYVNKEINDSKKLSEKKRELLYDEIIEHALGYGIAIVDATTIDKINIYEATKVAMKKAIEQIKCRYDLILTDAMKLDGLAKRVIPIIKGDAKALPIAAASILAKVSRDRLMIELAKKYPQYHFDKNKGYGTKDHLLALKEYGPIANIHRFSFRPVFETKYRPFDLFKDF